MFNRDALFGKKDEAARNEPRSSVNVTPGLGGANPPMRPQPPAEAPKPDLRFAEVPKQHHAQQAQSAQPARVDEPAGSRLIVGPDIKLKGVEITDCDTLVVEGRVEASMDSRVIQIAENGVFSGTVSIDVAEIRGTFEGALTARKQLVIYATGRVSGEIRYGKIRIEEGGEISGEISTLEKVAEVVSSTAASVTTAAAAPAAPAPAAQPAVPAAASASVSAPAAPAMARAPQPGNLALGEAQPSASAAASREPAPSRPPKGVRPNGAGVNTV
jgi:cytoskeletal protein CcmA (bactofilin family)